MRTGLLTRCSLQEKAWFLHHRVSLYRLQGFAVAKLQLEKCDSKQGSLRTQHTSVSERFIRGLMLQLSVRSSSTSVNTTPQSSQRYSVRVHGRGTESDPLCAVTSLTQARGRDECSICFPPQPLYSSLEELIGKGHNRVRMAKGWGEREVGWWTISFLIYHFQGNCKYNCSLISLEAPCDQGTNTTPAFPYL